MLSSAMPHARIALDAPPPVPGTLITSAKPCVHVHPHSDQGPDHRHASPAPAHDGQDAHHDQHGTADEDDMLVVVDPDALDFITHVPPLPPSLARTRTALLPPLATASGKSHTLLLDVDECLVACRTVPIANPDLTFSVHFNGTRFDIYGKLRPGVHAFLQALRSSPWEVVLFTASQHCYATRIRALLDPDGDCIAHLLHRDHCVPVLGNYLKDLSALGRDLRKTIIVDNSPQAFAYHPANGIAVPSWYDDQTDRALARLLPTLAKLAKHDDVRPAVFASSPLVARLTDHARHSGRVAVGLALALAAIHGDPPLDAPTPPMHLPHSAPPASTRLTLAAGGGAWPQFHHVEEPEYMETWDHGDGHVRLLPLHASAWPTLWRTAAEQVANAAVPAAAVVVAVDRDKRVSRADGDAARAADASYHNDLAPAEAAAAPAELLLAQGVPIDDEDEEGEAMELDIADEDAGDLTTSLVLCEHDRGARNGNDSTVPDAPYVQDHTATMHDPPAPAPPPTWHPTAAPPMLDLSATATIEFPPTSNDSVAASPLSWARPPSTTSTSSKLSRRCSLSPAGARAAAQDNTTPTGRRPSWATPTAAPRATVIPGKTSRRARANSVPSTLPPLALMPLTWVETFASGTPAARAATWGADDPMRGGEDGDGAWVEHEPVHEMEAMTQSPPGARSPVVRRARRPGTPPVQLVPSSIAGGGAGEATAQACGLALPSADAQVGNASASWTKGEDQEDARASPASLVASVGSPEPMRC